MIIEFRSKEYKITKYLFAYLLVSLGYLLYIGLDVQYNTAFVDEAIYATVGEEVLRKLYWENAISWMGGSYLYPIISATINRYYGLAGIRFFSTLCVLGSGILAGKVSKQLGGKYTEIITLFLFLFSANTMNLGQLGTYDIPSLLLTSLSFFLALKSRYKKGWVKLMLIFFSSISISVAVLSKYIAIMFIPTIALLFVFPYKIFAKNTKEIIKDILNFLGWIGVILTILLIYVAKYFQEIKSFFTGSVYLEPTSLQKIFLQISSGVNIMIIGMFTGLIFVFWKVKGEKKWLVFSFVVGGMSPLAYHLLFLNVRSLPKHTVFVIYFWAPITGWMLNKIRHKISVFIKPNIAIDNLTHAIWTIVAMLIITISWTNFQNHWKFQRSWISASNTIEYLRENRKQGDVVFAEGSTVYKYHLFSGFENPSAWPSTWYFRRENEEGIEAMKKAIKNKEFDFIVLNNYFTKEINAQILPTVKNHYEISFVDTYKVSGAYDQKTTVWTPKNKKTLEKTILSEKKED